MHLFSYSFWTMWVQYGEPPNSSISWVPLSANVTTDWDPNSDRKPRWAQGEPGARAEKRHTIYPKIVVHPHQWWNLSCFHYRWVILCCCLKWRGDFPILCIASSGARISYRSSLLATWRTRTRSCCRFCRNQAFGLLGADFCGWHPKVSVVNILWVAVIYHSYTLP